MTAKNAMNDVLYINTACHIRVAFSIIYRCGVFVQKMLGCIKWKFNAILKKQLILRFKIYIHIAYSSTTSQWYIYI